MGTSLRLWRPDDDSNIDGDSLVSGRVSADLRLSEFFALVMRPELEARRRRSGTTQIYLDTLGWWSKLAGDPPINQIDQRLVNTFRQSLDDALWKRGRFGEWRKLSAWSKTKYLRTLRAMFLRMGPGTASRPGEELVRRAPLVDPAAPEPDPKPCWTLDQARAILAATADVKTPRLAGVSPADWWRAFLALAAYTGLRRGTLLALRRKYLSDQVDGTWLRIPAEAVSKTRKRTIVAVHRLAREALERLPTDPDALLLPWPCHIRTLGDVHYRLQAEAGIPDAERHELHAWRRWHVNQLVELGVPQRIEQARQSLGHSASEITTGHYLTAHLALARALPDLW